MTTSTIGVTGDIDLKFVLSPVPHFALFAGPNATVTMWNHAKVEQNGYTTSSKHTSHTFGLSAGALAYF